MRRYSCLLFICAMILFTANAQASGSEVPVDDLTCTFTEPFIGVTYNAAEGKAVVDDHHGEPKVYDVEFVGDLEGFQLVSGTDIILSGFLNNNGSDGMSDYTYPFDAYYGPAQAGVLRGACYNDEYPRWVDEDIAEPGI